MELAVKIHKMTLRDLPAFELYETGSQIRKSSKSTKSNITEGFGRRWYKKDYLHFLTIALSSNDETADHLDTLFLSGSLKDKGTYNELKELNDKLGRKLSLFISSVKKSHRTDEKKSP
jgi:four helix bundle protein